MWKFLINMYITEPRAKHKGRFSALWYLIILSGGLTLLQINTILYPAPDISDIRMVEGTLTEVADHTGGRYPSVDITILIISHKQIEISASTTKEDALYYQQHIGLPIQVWCRWNMFECLAVQVILDDQMVRLYSKENQLKIHKFSLIFLYPFLALFFYALCKPWLVLIIRYFKERKHIL